MYFPTPGKYLTLSLISLISSTPLLLAASISITSLIELFSIPRQISHSLHGFSAGACSQLTAFAIIFAIEVFPVPRGPLNKYACAILLFFKAFLKVLVICSCPAISSKVAGLYVRYSAL